MKLQVMIHPAEEGGFWAEIPAFAGCVSEGETLEETLQNIKRLSQIDVGVNADLLGSPERKLATGRAGVDLNISKKNAFHFKVKNVHGCYASHPLFCGFCSRLILSCQYYFSKLVFFCCAK